MGIETSPVLFQVGSIGMLLNGIHDGVLSIEDLAKHGDTGIGTLEGVNGELIALDGVFYHADALGVLKPVSLNSTTFFAMVTPFQVTQTVAFNGIRDYESFLAQLDGYLASKNHIYMLKITGEFSNFKIRSLKKQEKPYRPFVEVLPEIQNIFEFRKIRGVMVGVRFPSYMNKINIPGYHFHFIDEEKEIGGHVFGGEVRTVKIEVCKINNFAMHLPDNEAFINVDFDNYNDATIKKVEFLDEDDEDDEDDQDTL